MAARCKAFKESDRNPFRIRDDFPKIVKNARLSFRASSTSRPAGPERTRLAPGREGCAGNFRATDRPPGSRIALRGLPVPRKLSFTPQSMGIEPDRLHQEPLRRSRCRRSTRNQGHPGLRRDDGPPIFRENGATLTTPRIKGAFHHVRIETARRHACLPRHRSQ